MKIVSRPTSNEYAENFDRIFRKEEVKVFEPRIVAGKVVAGKSWQLLDYGTHCAIVSALTPHALFREVYSVGQRAYVERRWKGMK